MQFLESKPTVTQITFPTSYSESWEKMTDLGISREKLMHFELEPETFWVEPLAAVGGIALNVPPHCFQPQAVIVAHIIVATAFDWDCSRLIASFSSIPVMFLAGSLLFADYPPSSAQHEPAGHPQ